MNFYHYVQLPHCTSCSIAVDSEIFGTSVDKIYLLTLAFFHVIQIRECGHLSSQWDTYKTLFSKLQEGARFKDF